MKNCLVLLTNYYPYYKGEEYLETEIIFLSNVFTKVIIVPTMVDNQMEKTRVIPENVEVINLNYRHTITNKVKFTLKKSDFKFSYEKRNIQCKLYQNYFNNRSQKIFKLLKEKKIVEKTSNYSEIIIYSYWLYITAQLGVFLKQELTTKLRKPVKLYSRAHRYDLYENETKLKFLPSRHFLLENIDEVFPCSDDGTMFLQKKYPEFSSKIHTERLGTSYYGKNTFFNNVKFEIVSCSALRPVKRVELIVEALKLLKKNNNIQFHWTHFGDGAEFEKINKLAQANLDKDSYELKGFVNNSEVLEFYKKNSVGCFVNVSKSEGIPVSIMEAMSFSIPSIATNVGGTNEIVVDGINGILLSKDLTSIDLAKAIDKILSLTEEEYSILRENAYQIWKEKYFAESNYLKFSEKISIL